ncbi:major facilitator superfamily transporter [Fusarium oxysporum f. sp. phaseoli]
MIGVHLFARTVPKYIADKCGRSNVMIVLAAFSEVVILALWLPCRNNIAIITVSMLFGLSSGAGTGLVPDGYCHVDSLNWNLDKPTHRRSRCRVPLSLSLWRTRLLRPTFGILLLRVRLGGWKLLNNIWHLVRN